MPGLRTTVVLAFLAFCAGARAQDADVPPDGAAQREAQERALAERRQQMIDECVANHGYEDDCAREADTELRAERAPVMHLRAPRR